MVQQAFLYGLSAARMIMSPGWAPVGWRIVPVSARKNPTRNAEMTPPLGLSERVPSVRLAHFPSNSRSCAPTPVSSRRVLGGRAL